MGTASHPLPVGARVAVLRLRQPSAPFIEGHAVIRRPSSTPDCYLVAFEGDPCPAERLVYPEFQRDPGRMLAILTELWRAENEADASFSSFFPDDLT